MTIFRAFVMAFVTYSRVPMPRIKWDEESAKYQLCFFPAIGIVAGAAAMAVEYLCGLLQTGGLFRSVMLAATPLLLTGGIHLDGFLDTVDALSCYGSKEKKLDVLKDSNAGAFAVIYGCVWFLAYTASMTEVHGLFLILPVGFVLSRALSALAVLTFRPARSDGMGAALRKNVTSKIPLAASFVWILLSVLMMLWVSPIAAVAVILVCLCEFGYYRFKSYREFGGFTGDLAGWFLCRCELEICLVLAVCERVMELWF